LKWEEEGECEGERFPMQTSSMADKPNPSILLTSLSLTLVLSDSYLFSVYLSISLSLSR